VRDIDDMELWIKGFEHPFYLCHIRVSDPEIRGKGEEPGHAVKL